ncbi:MAG: MarR family transcriptional regulator [Verrucomicrobia bacterium]|jgi:predicted transcriptional regulator|nr:MarR family transcriptional regulator [Verrucomicrobiota bacterium]
MAKDEVFSVLQRLGLNDTEIKCYYSLCTQGDSGATRLAERADVKRTNAYQALRKLEERGLITSTKKSASSVFRAESPAKLNRLFEEAQRSVDTLGHELQEIMDDLETPERPESTAPSVTEFVGSKGMRTVYEGILDSTPEDGELIGIVPGDFDLSPLADIGDWFVAERKRKNIKLLCMEPAETFLKVKAGDEENYRETRMVPSELVSKTALLEVSRSSIALAYWEKNEIHSIIVRHNELSNMIFNVLMMIWDNHCLKDEAV